MSNVINKKSTEGKFGMSFVINKEQKANRVFSKDSVMCPEIRPKIV